MSNLKGRTLSNSQNLLLGSEHVIHVEGDNESLDKQVMEILVPGYEVVPMGSSRVIRRFAETSVVYKQWPKRYFVVDRDHHSDAKVQKQKELFLSDNRPNLLFWDLREIENYFLDPNFLSKSQYLKKNCENKLRSIMEGVIKKSYLVDAANHTLGAVLAITSPNYEAFTIHDRSLTTFDEVKTFLDNFDVLNRYIRKLASEVSVANIIKELKKLVEYLEGEIEKNGCFSKEVMKYIQGKVALNEIINPQNSRPLFSVRDVNGNILQGKKRINEVVTKILEQPINIPDEIVEIRNTIMRRINR